MNDFRNHLFYPTNEMSSTYVQPYINALTQKAREAAKNLPSYKSINPTDYQKRLNNINSLDNRRAKFQSYADDKRDQENNPIMHSIRKGIGSFKRMVGLGEFAMGTYQKLADHIMNKSHEASVKANDYKAELKKTLAQHYNNKALRLFSVADNIESHIHRNGHLFKK